MSDHAPPNAIQPITLTINGTPYTLDVAPWTTLLDLLRLDLDLTGTKKGCDHGQCGACTVLIDDVRMNACLTLAIMKDGASITTVEGLAGRDGVLHPLQDAFIEHDAFQCGYCTPGQLCSAVGLLREGHACSAAEIREHMSGNLCRCGAYPNIVAAIEQVLAGSVEQALAGPVEQVLAGSVEQALAGPVEQALAGPVEQGAAKARKPQRAEPHEPGRAERIELGEAVR